MRWQVFIVFAFLAVVVEVSFINVLNVGILGGVTPSVVALLVVFICLFASRLSALSGALLLGLLLDLSMPALAAQGGRDVYLVGPHALGLLFGGYLIVQMRTMVFRQRAITLGVLTGICVLAAGILMTALFIIRGWYGEGVVYLSQPTAFGELVKYGAVALYSVLLGVPLGWMLLQTLPAWGFHMTHQRRIAR
jgi:hypothetical protein